MRIHVELLLLLDKKKKSFSIVKQFIFHILFQVTINFTEKYLLAHISKSEMYQIVSIKIFIVNYIHHPNFLKRKTSINVQEEKKSKQYSFRTKKKNPISTKKNMVYSRLSNEGSIHTCSLYIYHRRT